MNELEFSKIQTFDGQRIVIFERGEFSKPILLLENRDVERLIEEYNHK